MGGIVVRWADADDAPALAELRWQFKCEDAGAGARQGKADFVRVCEEWLRDRIGGPWRTWLAEVDGRPCGHVFMCLVEKVPSPFPDPEVLGYVTNFYVTPEQRGHGIGKALLDEVSRYARDHHLDTLVVWPSERSAPLYRRCGFGPPDELLEQPVSPEHRGRD